MCHPCHKKEGKIRRHPYICLSLKEETQEQSQRKNSEKTATLFSTRDGLGEKTTEKSPSSHSNFVYSLDF